jgi:transcriptional regulator with XRE-family HTH domain
MDPINQAQGAFARELRRARVEAGLTQEELADLASVSVGPIYLFESGKSSIRLDTLLKLLEAMGLELTIAPRKPS